MLVSRRAVLKAGGRIPLCIVLGSVAATVRSTAGFAQDATARASQFIRNLSQQAIQALTQPDISREERQRRARALLQQNFAIPTIGQFVLGRYWRVATPAEREEYLSLFEDMIIATYVDRFSRYSGQGLLVIDAVPTGEGGDVIVSSEITRANDKPVQVNWRVRERDGRAQIVDVYVEGVSMGQTQRSEFASVIQNKGSVGGLIEEMRRRVDSAT